MSKNIVKISSETLQILSNFATINPGLRFNSGVDGVGSKLISVDSSWSLKAHAVVKEVFPKEFFIYNLSRFLNTLKMPQLKGAEIDFDMSDDYMVIRSEDGKNEISYHYSDHKMDQWLDEPGAYSDLPEIMDDKISFSANIETTNIENIFRAASALNHDFLRLENVSGKSFMIASGSKTNRKSKSTMSDDYTQEIKETTLPDVELCFNLDMFKIIPGNYEFTVINFTTQSGSDMLALIAKNQQIELDYLIATSTD